MMFLEMFHYVFYIAGSGQCLADNMVNFFTLKFYLYTQLYITDISSNVFPNSFCKGVLGAATNL